MQSIHNLSNLWFLALMICAVSGFLSWLTFKLMGGERVIFELLEIDSFHEETSLLLEIALVVSGTAFIGGGALLALTLLSKVFLLFLWLCGLL